ncbi:MAG: EAL domain-containing protein [Pseudomonadaceae bacterium]|nr:EAL domain-containing protein [Pseudomonadaceae bacterium]
MSVRRIASDDYQARIADGGSGEVGLLAREFNHMQQDIAEREATISLLAYSDPLTGLDNRNRFVARLQIALADARHGAGVAVLLMDLDNFKDLNDTLGHEAGDQLLCLLGLQLKTAVNISALDLLNPDFAAFITSQLQEHQVDPASLVVEITESAVMSDPTLAMQQLEELRRLGAKLSIDDYGTGYSSMAQLKRLPVHELKIDKSFVSDLLSNPDDEIIVRSTIELAHNMGLKVVAEGVETQAVLEQLDRLGCDIAQGYLLSKPLAPAAFAEWLAKCPWPLPHG